MWNKFIVWLKAHNITTHTLVSAWVFLVGLFAASPAFRGYVMGLYNDIPSWLHEFIAAVIIPAVAYWKATKSAAPPQQ